MTLLSGLGIVLSLVFGCLLLALMGELYYLLWWKKQRIINTPQNNTIQQDYTTHAKEMFYLFCREKPTKILTNPNSTNPIGPNPDGNNPDPDIEMGLDPRKEVLLKTLVEEEQEEEVIDPEDILSLAGHLHPRFLFTIKEETKEDLESEDGRSKGDKRRTRSLSDLIMAIESQTPYLSPISSPSKYSNDDNLKGSGLNLVKKKKNSYNYNNPLFESSVEAEIYRLRSSPPPKFKFLRDAEEKLNRMLLEEAQRCGIFLEEGSLENSLAQHSFFDEEKDGFLMKNNGGEKKIIYKGNEREIVHCSSQVLPLASSPNCDV